MKCAVTCPVPRPTSHVPLPTFYGPKGQQFHQPGPTAREQTSTKIKGLKGRPFPARVATGQFPRRTNAFSKNWETDLAALSLWFAYDNFARKHITLTETLAMGSGLEIQIWTIRELIEESAKF